jgi:hypothetical protein
MGNIRESAALFSIAHITDIKYTNVKNRRIFDSLLSLIVFGPVIIRSRPNRIIAIDITVTQVALPI